MQGWGGGVLIKGQTYEPSPKKLATEECGLKPLFLSFRLQSLPPGHGVWDGRPRISHPGAHRPEPHPAGAGGAVGEKGHSKE